MLLDLLRMMGQLFRRIAEEGNAPETAEADESNMIGAVGEPEELDTPFTRLRRALPVVGMLVPSQPGLAMNPDEVAAWDMLVQHGFSHDELRRQGELEAYLSLGVKPETEARWRKNYLDGLLDRADAQPEGLDVALVLAAECGDAPAFQRGLEILDDSVSEEHLRDGAVLGSCLCAMVALQDAALAPDFAADAREQALETANRAEQRLRALQPDSPWLAAMAEIRGLAERAD